MTRHLLKLIWKRKRANALLMLEIFFSFLVLFAVVTLATMTIVRYRRPLGYDYQGVWVVGISFPRDQEVEVRRVAGDRDEPLKTPVDPWPLRDKLDRALREVRALPEVEAVAAAGAPSFSMSTWTSDTNFNGRYVEMTRDTVSDGYEKVMRAPVLRGRWFGPEDDASNIPPMVIDTELAEAMFGAEDPVGRKFTFGQGNDFRVVGVIAPFRKRGEFSPDRVQMAFGRAPLGGALLTGSPRQIPFMPANLVIRVRPGTPAEFEEALYSRIHAIVPDYPVRIRHMDQMRHSINRLFLAPVLLGAMIGLFLIGMVALGLSGVLWQSVTRRRREIGLRRALGATSSAVNRQILIEVALLATLAVVAGIVVVAQLPLLGAFKLVTPFAYTSGFTGALAAIYGITLLCGLYPSWLAGRVQPAEALHYE